MANPLPQLTANSLNKIPYQLGEWLRQLQSIVGGTIGVIPWIQVNKAGANLTDIPIRNHNDLANMQGGITSQYYHLTSAQATVVGNTSGTNTGDQFPRTIANGRATAQTAAISAVTTYTVGASDTSFIISANVNITTSTTHSFTVTCTYTDEGNTSRILTLSFNQLAGGTPITTITNVTGSGPYEGVPSHIRVKASTTITVATTGTFTSVTYNVEGFLQQLA